jgi:hypothetical protein
MEIIFIFPRSKRYDLHIWIHCTLNYLTAYSPLISLSMKVEFVHVKQGSKGSKLLQWATSQNCVVHKEHSQEHCSNMEAQSCIISGVHSAVPWEVFWLVKLCCWVSGYDVSEDFGASLWSRHKILEVATTSRNTWHFMVLNGLFTMFRRRDHPSLS